MRSADNERSVRVAERTPGGKNAAEDGIKLGGVTKLGTLQTSRLTSGRGN